VGTSPNGGQCVSETSQDLEQVSPAGENFVAENGVIRTNTNQYVLLYWPDSANILDDYSSVQSFTLQGTSGKFEVSSRFGQGSGRANDRIGWEISLRGTTADLRFCMWYTGYPICGGTYTGVSFPTSQGLDVQYIMTKDDQTADVYGWLSWRVGTRTQLYGGYIGERYYPNQGPLAYGIQGTGIRLSDIKLVTRSAIQVTLTDCISEEEFARMFYALSLADPDSTSWTVDYNNDDDANCKALGHGKALLSGFTFTIASAGAPASAIAQTFVANAATSGTVISTAAVIPGTAGATAAGLPGAATAGSAVVGTIPGAAAAGGGGGAAGGLSGGAIAGIVIGSVAGGVLLLGLTAVVIGAVIVGAIALSKKEDEPSRADSGNRRSVRQTIVGLFSGVDVMNNPGKGHQSISGRAPAMNA